MRPPQMTTSSTINDGQSSLRGHQHQHHHHHHNNNYNINNPNNNNKNNNILIHNNEILTPEYNRRTILINSESDGLIFYNQYKNDLNINSSLIKRSETTNCGKLLIKNNSENNFGTISTTTAPSSIATTKQLNNFKIISNDESDETLGVCDSDVHDDNEYYFLNKNEKLLRKTRTNHDNFINHLTECLITKNPNNLTNDIDKFSCLCSSDINQCSFINNYQENNFKKISTLTSDVPKNLIVNRLYDKESDETIPLLNKHDQTKFDELNKIKNLKEDIPIVHRRPIKARKSQEIRRSLQWPIGCGDNINSCNSEDNSATTRKNQFHSWYASGYDTLIEELEQDIKDNSSFHNLAGARSINSNGTRESASLLEQQNNQIRTRRSVVCLTSQQNLQEGPHAPSLGGPAPTRKRFGQFLKSLVGRKSSKDTTATTTTVPTNTTTTTLLQAPELIFHSDTPSINSLTNLTQSRRRIGNSTTSLNAVHQKLWSVVPLLRKETSCSNLNQTKFNSIVYETHLRKCNTVLALSKSSSSNYLEPIRPLNRLRNYTSIATCSRCSSLLSLAASSKYSLNVSNGGFVTVGSNCSTKNEQQQTATFVCKLCLGEIKFDNSTNISQCGCLFCSECMTAYVEFEILEGAYEISCPDAMCPSQGILTLPEIMLLASPSLVEKHRRYRLNREVELDINRTWCPKAGCETVCLVGPTSSEKATTLQVPISPTSLLQSPCSVHCPTCEEDFCSGCKKTWHPTMSCDENIRRLAADGHDDSAGISFDSDLIKCCPMCAVPIEKDEGCAQMMCKRCKHVFCWYCLASLDDDFLLRHYDKGPCKNKLGHSRASVVWHRAQVIGIFAGFGILLLVASPLLLLAAPCIVCCKCRVCSGTAKLEEADNEFDDVIALQRN